MTGSDYLQLKAFARVDGALFAVVLVLVFVLYVAGLDTPTYSLAAMALALLSPVFVGWRMKCYREQALGGQMSFMRGWCYAVFMSFYAGLLFALFQYVYFAYIDKGFMVDSIVAMMALPENATMIEALGLKQQIGEALEAMRSQRPIDISLSSLTSLMFASMLLGIPVAAIVQRGVKARR